MGYRLSIALTFTAISLLLLTGCATTIHKVNASAIDANRSKVFLLGIVKVIGGSPIGFGDRVDKKKMALERMPIEEICSVLTSNFGIKVDTQVDKFVRTVKEPLNNQGNAVPASTLPGWSMSINITPQSENPYWGKKEYKQAGISGAPKLQDENTGNMVYITYEVRPDNKGVSLPWSLKEIFYYDIRVTSDSTVLLHYAGPVAVVDMPKKGLIIDFEGYWDKMVSYVDRVPAAFAKDTKIKNNM